MIECGRVKRVCNWTKWTASIWDPRLRWIRNSNLWTSKVIDGLGLVTDGPKYLKRNLQHKLAGTSLLTYLGKGPVAYERPNWYPAKCGCVGESHYRRPIRGFKGKDGEWKRSQKRKEGKEKEMKKAKRSIDIHYNNSLTLSFLSILDLGSIKHWIQYPCRREQL